MSPSGLVFELSHGCVDDGPGLRTVVFLKGCSLGCPWCQNPEGISSKAEIAFDAHRCIDCGRCAEACPEGLLDGDSGRNPAWREGCQACGRCARACPSGARRLVGRRYEVRELVDELLQDRDYFAGTGGGVTFSGGEPLLQADFLLACAEALASEGVHVAVETAGLWPGRLIPRLTHAFDLVLFDLKHVDPTRLGVTMGNSYQQVLDNMTTLLSSGVELEIRLTLVPGINDGIEDVSAIASYLSQERCQATIRLQGFHRLAVSKTARFASSYAYENEEPVTAEQLAMATRVLDEHGLTVARD